MLTTCVKSTPLTFERFNVPCSLVREDRPSLYTEGLPSPSFHTATFCVGCPGGLNAKLFKTWHCWFHKNLRLFSWFFDQRRQILQLRGEEYREFHYSDAQLVFVVFHYAITVLLSFEHIWTQTTIFLAQIVSGLVVT